MSSADSSGRFRAQVAIENRQLSQTLRAQRSAALGALKAISSALERRHWHASRVISLVAETVDMHIGGVLTEIEKP